MDAERQGDSSGNAATDHTQCVFAREQELAGEVPGEVLLPVIRRCVAAGSAIADRLDDVIAVYPHRLVMMTIRRRAEFSDAAFALYGAEVLLQMESVGPVLVARWDEIRSIRWSRVR